MDVTTGVDAFCCLYQLDTYLKFASGRQLFSVPGSLKSLVNVLIHQENGSYAHFEIGGRLDARHDYAIKQFCYAWQILFADFRSNLELDLGFLFICENFDCHWRKL